MRWSSVTTPRSRLQKASVCVDPSEIAHSDANLTQVTEVAGEERPADSRGLRRHGNLSEQTSVRALSRTDADDQGDFRYPTSSRCSRSSPRLRPLVVHVNYFSAYRALCLPESSLRPVSQVQQIVQ